MRRVYVAGAYSDNNVIGVLTNMRLGMRASTEVFLAGFAPFSPWLDYHFVLQLQGDEQITVEDFYEYSLAWLRAADVVYVLPDWEQSKGTRAEIAEAERHGIPVVYSMEELKQWHR